MKFNIRAIHRDFAYFYVGLIIAFSVSGIALNHRRNWDPMQYKYDSKDIELDLPESQEISEENIKEAVESLDMQLEFRGFRNQEENLTVFVTDGMITLDPISGKGKLELMKRRPVLGNMTLLHKTTDRFWIWYSDIFGIAMLLITITGMFIAKGNKNFATRGWIFAVAGIIFPIVFLLFLS